MSNRSSMSPPQEHDIHKLIQDKKEKEAKAEMDKELTRQKDFLNKNIFPFLYKSTKSITMAKVLINRTIEALQKSFQEKMKEEQARLSTETLHNLDIDERLERTKEYETERALLREFKDEKVGTVISLLSALHVTIAGAEMEENSKRTLEDLKLKV